MKLKNYHFFKIKGLNQERLFNKLSKNIQLFEINRLEKNLSTFKVKFFDGKKVQKILHEDGFQIIEHKKSGFLSQLAIFCTSYGLIAGLVISVLLYGVQAQFIQNIQVYGVENCAEIEQYLKTHISSKYKSSIDIQQIEHMINDNFDDLSFISGAIVGQTLVVNLKSQIIPPEMQSEFSPIVSQYDGVITKISLIQGTLKVKVGDIIQKGQILVEPKVVNSSGEEFNIQPKAQIYMDVWFEGEATHFDKQVITFRTGKKCENVSVMLFGAEFYNNGVVCDFDSYESQQKTINLCNNNLLPFKIVKTTYFQLESQTIISTFEEKQDEIINLAKQNCLQKIDGCEIIKNESYRILQGAGSTTVKYVITANILASGENNENLLKQT